MHYNNFLRLMALAAATAPVLALPTGGEAGVAALEARDPQLAGLSRLPNFKNPFKGMGRKKTSKREVDEEADEEADEAATLDEDAIELVARRLTTNYGLPPNNGMPFVGPERTKLPKLPKRNVDEEAELVARQLTGLSRLPNFKNPFKGMGRKKTSKRDIDEEADESAAMDEAATMDEEAELVARQLTGLSRLPNLGHLRHPLGGKKTSKREVDEEAEE
ncbi:hypothetical protein GGTG_13651 [Gaeumannomyces tritici R3-111a-1]|uniref:Uncharacterized protein n=1 Tax=Gaeumannomyces tritici (strain R3-111a-1) TaxID=644352 RepID=J3PJG9_GAET3|nr:hypothetical protein GGTG_13651 [Gaeumannomyces tritici R3-111a-1]EJT68774.1 hypothetical protein GGTG_13651 [Gaeumannomyces tritici R3-111a-1]